VGCQRTYKKRKFCTGSAALTAILAVVLLGLTLFLPPNARAAEKGFETAGKKVVILVMDRVTLQDLASARTPNVDRLIKEGAVGLMNTRTAGSRNSPNAYATIGAGKHVVSSVFAADSFNCNSVIEQVPVMSQYVARTGKEPPPGGVVCLGIPRIINNNEREGISSGPGMLGETLHRYGLKTAVLGNADVQKEFHREAVTIAMDRWGTVDMGNVSRNLVKRVPESPLLYQTDYEALVDEFRLVYPRADLIVVETGDLYRADLVSRSALPEIISRERRAAIERADGFVGRLLEMVDRENTMIMLVAPLPPEDAMKQNTYMTPLVVFNNSPVKGLLTSGTTRRKGIIANTDIAPTVLEYLGVPVPSEMTGRPLALVHDESPVSGLLELSEDLVFIYRARPVVVKGYVFLQIITMLLVTAVLVFWPRLLRYSRPLLLWLIAVPLSLLLISPLRFLPLPLYALAAVTLAALVVFAAYRVCPGGEAGLFIFLGLVTAGSVLLDVFAGAALIKYSTLGYDAMSGARYYGIGNEFVGVALGSSIIGAASLWERFEKKHAVLTRVFTAVFFAAAVFLMGAPQFGSNVGGTIAAVAAYLFTYFRLLDVKVGARQMLAIAGSAACMILVFALIDMGRSVEVQSHLGRAASLIQSQGWPAVWEVIQRKVSMNVKLIRYTIWSRVFLALLGALAVAFYRPVGLMDEVRRNYPRVFQGLLGILVGSGVALAVNDSGIVAAATMMIYGTAPLIYLMSRVRESG